MILRIEYCIISYVLDYVLLGILNYFIVVLV